MQLQQVVLNLVRNATDALKGKMGDRRIRVASWCAAESSSVIISVTDNGPGVDKDLADRLFEPLLTSKQQGLGLGLSICASIVEAHHGRIWLETTAPGMTEFRVSLPVEQSGTVS